MPTFVILLLNLLCRSGLAAVAQDMGLAGKFGQYIKKYGASSGGAPDSRYIY